MVHNRILWYAVVYCGFRGSWERSAPFEHGRLQVRMLQPGHVYLAASDLQISHGLDPVN